MLVWASLSDRHAEAEGGLLVTPQRVVVASNTREAQVTLSNLGNEAAAYRLFFVNYKMTPDGAFEEVTAPEPGQHFADSLVTYSPRQVVLPPQQTQVARLRVRVPSDLPAGEYRSHLVFQTVPKRGSENQTTSRQGQTRAAIRTLYGISIPVIVRHQTTRSTAGLERLEFRQPATGAAYIDLAITREGDESVYGDLNAFFVPAKGKRVPLGESNGVAVYPPLPMRKAKIPITVDRPLAAGKIRVEYRDPAQNNALLAEKELELR